MKEKVDLDLIRKYSKGQYSFRDLKRIAIWFEDSEYQDEIESAIEVYWRDFEASPGEQAKDLSLVFRRLKKQILAEKTSLSFTQKFTRVYGRIAAVLLIPLLVYSLFNLSQKFFVHSKSSSWVEIVSPNAARTHFELPDGSHVSLNGGTHLKYNADFENDRRVEVKGEAYFDVVHNESAPFVVQTDELDVKVLGTKFSVAAFENENQVEVILEEGKVELTGVKNSFSEILKPNEGFFYSKKSHSGIIKKIEANYYMAWKDGILIFRSEPLSEVFKRIGHWYNVQFDLQDKSIEGFMYRATFKNESLEEVLRLIALTAPIEYELNKRDIDKSGIYTEKLINVKRKK